jgi:guanine nucleotide-binding protein G(I)/G(S)/G(T) subunit beta-1
MANTNNIIKEQIENLKSRLITEQHRAGTDEAFKDLYPISPVVRKHALMVCGTSKDLGHIYAFDWAGNSSQIVSIGESGNLTVWNARTTKKILTIPLRLSWVMTCACQQTPINADEYLVACGGLDNLCSIYKIRLDDTPVNHVKKKLAAHDGYISCCQFVGQNQLLTSSGDSTCILWDIERGEIVCRYYGHAGDVMSIAVNPTDQNVFVSGSCDSSAKVWDVRNPRCIMTFRGHETDINSVRFFPSGTAIGTGSDDSSCRLWDLRAVCEMNQYRNDRIVCGVTCIDFSKSGRLLFVGYDDYSCHGWDVIGQRTQISMRMSSHQNRVCSLRVNPLGSVLCTNDRLSLKLWV